MKLKKRKEKERVRVDLELLLEAQNYTKPGFFTNNYIKSTKLKLSQLTMFRSSKRSRADVWLISKIFRDNPHQFYISFAKEHSHKLWITVSGSSWHKSQEKDCKIPLWKSFDLVGRISLIALQQKNLTLGGINKDQRLFQNCCPYCLENVSPVLVNNECSFSSR